MEPQQSLQPDQPDDDADQDADQPPPHPSPTLLDTNALSLVAQPLASAAARVAASLSLPLPLDDLNDFDVDLSWAAPDIDSLFLNDTQYLQLGDERPPSTPTPAQPAPRPARPSTADTHLVPDAQPQPSTSQSDALPPLRTRSFASTQKRSRPRLAQASPKHNPIPIAPRTAKSASHLRDLTIKSSPPTPRSAQAHSSPLQTKRLKSAPPVQALEPATAAKPCDAAPTQNAPNTVSHFPMTLSPHPMIPLMNMYPLQHHQSVFQPAPPVLSSTDPNTPESKSRQPPKTLNSPDAHKSASPDPQPPPSASNQPSQSQPVAQQRFVSPRMQVIPPGVVSYDAGMMPFFQMAYAAAAARYPQGIVPPLPAGSNIPSTMLNHFGPNRPPAVQHENNHNIPIIATDASTVNHAGQQPSRQHAKPPGAPVLVRDGGTQVFVHQQKAARLERHPVLGRLQLKSASKQQIATSSGTQTGFVSDTQNSSGENQHKAFQGSTPGTPSDSKSGPLAPRDAGQRQQKKRLVWTPELHDRFLKAINAVGLSQAVPKTLVTIMNVEGLTTEHVKSHLQKYRNSLRKEAEIEEQDKSRGGGPSVGPHNIKLGTPGASGASVLQSVGVAAAPGSATNQSGQGGSAVTNTGGRQRLPILPSRINAFGGQTRGMIQPALEAKVSPQVAKSAPTLQTTLGSNERRGGSRSPRLPSTHSPQRPEASHAKASSAGATTQPPDAPSATAEGRDEDRMQVDTGALGAENINASTQGSDAGTVTQGSRNRTTGQDAPGAADVVSATPEVQSAETLGSTGLKTQVNELQKLDADSLAKKVVPQNGAEHKEKEEFEVGSTPSQGGGSAGPEGQRKPEGLELMKEETQQMQLQVQMMVYRTIALEKKLEEIHSERVNVEASGTGDASKRSAVGDMVRRKTGSGECGAKDEATENKGESADTRKQDEVGISNGGHANPEELTNGNENVGTKKRRYGSVSNEQSEIKALLSEQKGLQKRIQDGLAMIDKRMRRAGDETFEKESRSMP